MREKRKGVIICVGCFLLGYMVRLSKVYFWSWEKKDDGFNNVYEFNMVGKL